MEILTDLPGWLLLVFKIIACVVMLVYAICHIRIVNEWDRVPLLRFGKYHSTLEPGFHIIAPFCRTLDAVPINDEVWPLKLDRIQTHDNVPIALTMILTSQIDRDNVKKWITNVLNGDAAIEQRAVSIASEVVSGLELNQILHDRKILHDRMLELLNLRVSTWGIAIKAIEFKDISISDQVIQEAIALKARAVREGEAELARAIKQKEIAEALNLAAEAYTEHGKWLKGTEVLLEMCRSAQNNTVLVPTDMVEALARVGQPLRSAGRV